MLTQSDHMSIASVTVLVALTVLIIYVPPSALVANYGTTTTVAVALGIWGLDKLLNRV